MSDNRGLRGLLALIAILLAANLVVLLARPVSAPGAAVLPSVQAGDVMRLDGSMMVTTNQAGDTLTIWRLGRFVNDGYESADARVYYAAGTGSN